MAFLKIVLCTKRSVYFVHRCKGHFNIVGRTFAVLEGIVLSLKKVHLR